MTANGLRLAQLAKPLADAGLSRVNVSLDTLDRHRFLDITKRDRFSAVIDGIAAARDAGLRPVKVNTILQRGVNDDEAVPLLRHARANGWRLRFIEQMPLDAGGCGLASLFGASVDVKAAGHGINNPAFCQPARPMSAIGG